MHDYGPNGQISDAFVFTATVDGITVIWGDGEKRIHHHSATFFIFSVRL